MTSLDVNAYIALATRASRPANRAGVERALKNWTPHALAGARPTEEDLVHSILSDPYSSNVAVRMVREAMTLDDPAEKSRLVQRASRLNQLHTLTWGERFLSGVQEVGSYAGSGILRSAYSVTGLESLRRWAAAYELSRDYHSRRAVGVAGTVGALATGVTTAVPAAYAAGAGLAGFVAAATPGFVIGYGNSMSDIEAYEVDNGVSFSRHFKFAISIAQGAVEGLEMAFIGTRAIRGLGTALRYDIGSKVLAGKYKEAAKLLAKQVGLESAETGVAAGFFQAAHNYWRSWYDEDQKPFDSSFGVAFAVGAALQATFGIGGALRWVHKPSIVRSVLRDARSRGYITDAEADQLTKYPELVPGFLSERHLDKNIVSIAVDEGGKPYLKLEPTRLSHAERAMVGHDPELMRSLEKMNPDARRNLIGSNVDNEVPHEKFVSVLGSLTKAVKDYRRRIPLEEIKNLSTVRGAFVRDLELTLRKLLKGDRTEAWLNVSRAEALFRGNRANRWSESKAPFVTSAPIPEDSLAMPIRLWSTDAVKMSLSDDVRAALKIPYGITPLTEKRLRTAQKWFLERFSAIQDPKLALTLEGRKAAREELSARFLERVDRILNSDSDGLATLKSTIRRFLKSPKGRDIVGKEERKPLSDRILSAAKTLSFKVHDFTQKDMLDQLSKLFPEGSSEHNIVRSLRDSMDPATGVLGSVNRLEAALGRLQIEFERISKKLKAKEDFEKLRESAVRIVKENFEDYPEGQKLLAMLVSAKTPERISNILSEIKPLKDRLAEDKMVARVSKYFKKLGSNPERQRVLEELRRVAGEAGVAQDVLIRISPKTGYESVNRVELSLLFRNGQIPLWTRQAWADRLIEIAHEGVLFKDVYRLSLGYSVKETLDKVKREVVDIPVISPTGHAIDTPKGVVTMVADPSSIRNRILDFVKGNTESTFFQVFDRLRKSYSRSQRVVAEFNEMYRKNVSDLLEFDLNSRFGTLRYAEFLNEKPIEGIDITRGEAMNVYALYLSRRQALLDRGYETRGLLFKGDTVEKIVNGLGDKDKELVIRTLRLFEDNPHVEAVFRQYAILHGRDPGRPVGLWAPNKSKIQTQHDITDMKAFSEMMASEVGLVKPRKEEAAAPFDVEGGFDGAFQNAVEKIALYGQMAGDLYMAQRMLLDQDVSRELQRRVGKVWHDKLLEYVANIRHSLSDPRSPQSQFFNYFTSAYATSTIGTNLTSVAKQFLGLLTFFGDGRLGRENILSSFAAMKSKSVSERMVKVSGLAASRFGAQRWLLEVFGLAHRNPSPKLAFLQELAMTLQKVVDERTLRVAFRSAERLADQKGLRGAERLEFIREVFEDSVGVTQASANPIYITAFELEAVKHPSLRTVTVLQRELNRIYNVQRARVMEFLRKPSVETAENAIFAVLFTTIAGSMVETTITDLGRKVFGRPERTAAESARLTIRNVMGQLYLVGDVADILVDAFDTTRSSPMVEKMLNPATGLVKSLADSVFAVRDWLVAEEGEEFKSGKRRGEEKRGVAAEKFARSLGGMVSSVLGLPFMVLWDQAYGLYSWSRDDIRLMWRWEKEWETVRRGREDDPRRALMESARKRINAMHRARERGVISREEYRAAVIGIISEVLK